MSSKAERNIDGASGQAEVEAGRRNRYTQERLREVAGRLKELAAEREGLTATLAARAAETGPEVRDLRDRRSYLGMRIEALRAEQAALKSERAASNPAPKASTKPAGARTTKPKAP